MRDRPPSARGHLRRAKASGLPILISSIVQFELWHGVFRSERPTENAERLNFFLAGAVELLPFERDDATVAAQLRTTPEQGGRLIGPYDLLIAAQTLRHNATLVTANTAELARVPGLVLEDWTT